MNTPQLRKLLLTCLACLLFNVPTTAQLIIDDFDDTHDTPAMASTISTNSAILGGEREVDNSNNALATSNANSEFLATLNFFNSVRLVYDGDDEDTDVFNHDGLNGLDLASTSDALLINGVQTLQASVTIDIAFYSSAGNSSFFRQALPSFLEPVNLTVPFSDFEVLEGDGVDFSNIGAIEIVIAANDDTFFYMNSLSLTDTPLPVELTAFTALVEQNDVVLNWETASELNNAGFFIEQATPTSNEFVSVGFHDGFGTTNVARSYKYTLTGLSAGIHQFRLKQIDFDGTFEYSPTVEIQVVLEGSYQLSAAYPNPFNPQSTFSLSVAQDQDVLITLHDVQGREVDHLFNGFIPAQSEQQFLINGFNLPSGTYFYRVEGEFFKTSGQVLLVK